MICAIVPARGGSRGIPRKNLRPFLGRPLVCHAVDAGLGATLVERVIVSTDDPEIAAVARAAGAETPFLRPAALATDETPTLPVLQHAVRWLEQHGTAVSTVVVLQPTSPLRSAAHVDAAVRLFLDSGAESVASVCEVDHSPYWMHRLDGDRLVPFAPEGAAYLRRQDLPPVYRLNGAIYVTRRPVVMDQARVLGDDTRAFVMDRQRSIDIDDELDFQLAELVAGAEVRR
jgi:CMP-N-acetylneuraminic acid synthetase